MKCDYFRENIASLFDETDDSRLMREHMETCGECRRYYSEFAAAVDSVTPGEMPATPKEIAANVVARIANADSRKGLPRRIYKIAGSIAAVVCVAVVAVGVMLNAPGRLNAAESLLDRSIANTGEQETMIMKLGVRTYIWENFEYINLYDTMIAHTIYVIASDPHVWRVERDQGRTVLWDGETRYMWWKKYAYKTHNVNFSTWMNTFVDPARILENARELAKKEGVKSTMRETADEIFLTLNVPAQGDYNNDYLLNSSVEEANTRREYVFDRKTELIKGLKIFVEDRGAEVLVVEMKDVRYNVPLSRAMVTALPQMEWEDRDRIPANNEFVGITAQEAVRKMFEAMGARNTSSLGDVVGSQWFDTLDEYYGGCRIVEIGTPFKSGTYAGVFVPYRLVLADGSLHEANLAIRNDNPDKVWVLDGGF